MDNALTWARKRKGAFAKKFIKDAGVEKKKIPVAFFMAGLPGAGKTEFTKELIGMLKVKILRLDMDEIATQIDLYAPEKADRFRAGASLLLNKIFDIAVKGKYDFIMDGTFGSKYALMNVKRALTHGYRVKVIFLNQDPKIAWNYTMAREKVERRAIDKDGFIESYIRLKDNLQKLSELCDDRLSVDIIIKNERMEQKEWLSDVFIKDIDDIVNMGYNKDSIRKMIYE